MSSFIASPVWAAVVSLLGSGLIGLTVMIARMTNKVNQIGDKVADIAQDVTDIKNDSNIVRWSDLARARRNRRRGVI